MKANTDSEKAQILYCNFYPHPDEIIVDNVDKDMDEDCKISVNSYETTKVVLNWDIGFNDFSYMFYSVSDIISIDLSEFDYKGVTTMEHMFCRCTNLESINFGNFDTSLVEEMHGLFAENYNLLSVDLSNLDVSKVEDMSFLFYHSGINSVNLKNWKTSSLKNMYAMFGSCYYLKSLDISSFETSNVEDMGALFYECFELESIDLSNFDNSKLSDINMMFYSCENLKDINLKGFNTQNVYNMSCIFAFCLSLISVDISSFQTDNVIDMSTMFYGCSELKEIKFGNFNTEKVLTTIGMFYECISLTSLDLSSFTLSNVQYIYYMFYKCESLNSLDLSKFKTLNVLDMGSLFRGCSALTYLNLNNFDTSQVTRMDKMFANCTNLEILEFKGIIINSECTFISFFEGCDKLSYINFFLLNEETSSFYDQFDILMDRNDIITICINDETKIPNIFNKFKSLQNPKRDCSNKCYSTSKIFYPEEFLCIDKCEDMQLVEYNSDCIKSCPDGMSISSENKCIKLSCENYYDYDKKNCINEIPPGFFCNDTIAKTIDKCHSDCEQCDKKWTESNTNCISCNTPKILKEGNCVTDCPQGAYSDNGISKCKCDIEKCFLCSEQSLSNDLCISCNNDKNYYQKLNDEKNKDNFIECYNNLEKYYLNGNNIYEPCFESCQSCDKGKENDYHNCKTCATGYNYMIDYGQFNINCYETCPHYFYFDESKMKYYCTIEEECPENYQFLIHDGKKCIDDCKNEDEYILTFRNECFKECPQDTEKIDYYCHILCTKDFPFEVVSNQTCVSKCSINEFSEEICIINYYDNETNVTMEDVMINFIQEDLVNGYDTSEVDEGNDVSIDLGNTTSKATISSTKNQKKLEKEINNITSINFEKCESKLREYYKIPEDEYFYILILEVPQPGTKVVKIEYKVYYPLHGKNLEKLELTPCKDVKVDIFIPIELDDDVNKLNSSSDYYNDICFTLNSENGTNITLKDRQNNFVEENRTICEEHCQFIKYNYDTKKAVCSCEIKIKLPIIPEIKFDKNKLYDSFTDIKNIANLNILKCYKLFFAFENILKNYGCLIMILIFIIHIICSFIFCLVDFKKIKTTINDIIFAKNNWNHLRTLFNRENTNIQKTRRNSTQILDKNKIIPFNNNNHAKKSIIINNNKINQPPAFFRILNKLKKNKIKNRLSMPFMNQINIPNKNNNKISIIHKSKQLETTGNSTTNILKNASNNKYEYYINLMDFNDYELNQMTYKQAIKNDKRSYISYYFSLIRQKHLLIFSFFPMHDYNSQAIKVDLFFMKFSINIAVNALFFNDGTIHKIYEEAGHFNLLYQLPQIIYSSLISGIINTILNMLSLTGENIIKIKHLKNDVKKASDEISKTIEKKLIFYFVLTYIILLFFWYYVGCFCAIYKNTQIHLIKDTIISFGTSFISPFLVNLLPGIFRISSLKKNKKENMFKFSKIIQSLI